MSLVSTYVRAIDGHLYKNPSVDGAHWFVCFDDEEPPELVVEEGYEKPVLSWFRISKSSKRRPHKSIRCFNGDFNDSRPAVAYFGSLRDRIPVPQRHDGIAADGKTGQGVVYDPVPRSKRKKRN